MLSIENETLRGENDELKVKSTKNAAADDSKVPGKHGGKNVFLTSLLKCYFRDHIFLFYL